MRMAHPLWSQGHGLLIVCLGVILTGCAARPKEMTATQPGQAAGGAGIRLPDLAHATASREPDARRFVCVVTGRGRAPDRGEPHERRDAAMQAAIFSALHRAIAAGGTLEPDANGRCNVALSERLTLLSAADGARIALRYDNRGRTHSVDIVDERLAHPPLRSDLVARFLAEVNDSVRLVSTAPAAEPGQWVAKIACYEQATADSQPAASSQPVTTHAAR